MKKDIRWKPWEISILKNGYKRYGDAARLLPLLQKGRTIASVQGKVKQFGLTTRRYPSIPYTVNELAANTKKNIAGCWIWQGEKRPNGYGVVKNCGARISVHRLMFLLWNKVPIGGKLVLHHCDIRDCINPEHIYLGTYTDNNRDTVKRGRYRNQYGPRK